MALSGRNVDSLLEEPIALSVDEWSPALMAMIAEQEELFGRLETLCQRQAGLVRAEETDLLLALLGERQELVGRIAEASAALDPFRKRWDRVMAALPEEQREDVRRRLRMVGEAAARVARQDEEDRRVMEGRREAIAAEMAGIARGRGAMAAYGGAAGTGASPRFQDREA